jgi:hypothetical protein
MFKSLKGIPTMGVDYERSTCYVLYIVWYNLIYYILFRNFDFVLNRNNLNFVTEELKNPRKWDIFIYYILFASKGDSCILFRTLSMTIESFTIENRVYLVTCSGDR